MNWTFMPSPAISTVRAIWRTCANAGAPQRPRRLPGNGRRAWSGLRPSANARTWPPGPEGARGHGAIRSQRFAPHALAEDFRHEGARALRRGAAACVMGSAAKQGWVAGKGTEVDDGARLHRHLWRDASKERASHARAGQRHLARFPFHSALRQVNGDTGDVEHEFRSADVSPCTPDRQREAGFLRHA